MFPSGVRLREQFFADYLMKTLIYATIWNDMIYALNLRWSKKFSAPILGKIPGILYLYGYESKPSYSE